MTDFMLSEIKHLWYCFKYLPQLKKLEHSISQNVYFSSLPSNWIKDKLYLDQNDEHNEKVWGLTHELNQLKELFKSLPLKTKLKQINQINFYIDTHTFYEDFTYSSFQKKVVIENYIVLFYAQSILSELHKEKHKNFIKSISEKLHAGEPGFVLSANHEEKMILHWQLDSDMATKEVNSKPSKI